MADTRHHLAATAAVIAPDGRALGGGDLRTAVAALAERLPAPTPGSHVVFAFDLDRAAFAVALLAVWQRGHAVALPASARRRHVGPVMARADVVALVHDTGAGLGIDVARLLAAPAEARATERLAVAGPLTVFAADGSVRSVAASALEAEIARTVADLQLRAGGMLANLCPLHSAGALVPGLLAPLAAGALVAADAHGADVLVAPVGRLPAKRPTHTIAVEDPPEPPPPSPPRRALVFAAIPATNGELARFRTEVPRDFFGFAGHFPTYPVLSGAVQLHELVLPCLRAACGTATVAAFQDLKFLARIGPGDTVEIALRVDAAKGTCEFELLRERTRCSTGRAVLRAAGTESAS